ncbi:LysR family transcriptional regulator [Ferrimonas lipolytica]|uniref:LysR family transcriptional regulator n=1 Tax=Ferrimonas lipolytica TaxID=2724191 RepID=A0A6H1UI59_9GAMM|nr:LysR family transcriptional regulator [Ferrimonas lipolytica]QIZ78724.1 LysR family transcriptional regulator [Ferrimonas lipolytica]
MDRLPEQLDFNLLKVFEAIYTEQSISRAGEVLHVTPSAVSHALKRLRERMGEPLFERRGQQMVPTPSCQRMAPQLLATLAQLRQLLQSWGKFEPVSAEQHFQLGISEALESLLLPQVCDVLQQHAPHCRLTSRRFSRDQMERLLVHRQLDLIIDIQALTPSGIAHHPLMDDQLVVASNDQLEQLNLKQYQQAKHIEVSSRPSGRVLEEYALDKRGLSRQVAVRCQSYQSALALAAQSELLVTLPSSIALAHNCDDMQIWPLPFTTSHISIHLYWHQSRENDPALQWLIGQLNQVFAVETAQATDVSL